MVKNVVEEPVNSSSTLKKEAESISEILVAVYKRSRRLVPRIPQYFNCLGTSDITTCNLQLQPIVSPCVNFNYV